MIPEAARLEKECCINHLNATLLAPLGEKYGCESQLFLQEPLAVSLEGVVGGSRE